MQIIFFTLGAALGVIAKLLDIYTSNLGNIFSQMSIWILLGTLIAVFSRTKRQAAARVFLFCVGMLITYYITAEVTDSVYGMSFVYGWAAFSLCSPVFAVLTWMTKEKGLLPKLISVGILAVTLGCSIVLFGGPRAYDAVMLLVLVYVLFFAKIKR